MRVTTGQIIARGLLHRCPNCGAGTLLGRWLRVKDQCSRCGLRFEREPGFFLGALVFNYTATAVVTLFPLLILVFTGRVSMWTALLIAAVSAVVFPILFYPTSKSLWLMTYYVFVPGDLPANQGQARDARRPR